MGNERTNERVFLLGPAFPDILVRRPWSSLLRSLIVVGVSDKTFCILDKRGSRKFRLVRFSTLATRTITTTPTTTTTTRRRRITRRRRATRRKKVTTMATSSLGDLISSVQPLLPTSLRQDAWYIVLIAALVASGRPEEVGPLFGHVMTSKTASAAVAGESLGDGSGERGSGEKEKERVSLRFRDVLMKTWTLTGIPPVIVAFGSLAKEEGEDKERAEGSELSEKWYVPHSQTLEFPDCSD